MKRRLSKPEENALVKYYQEHKDTNVLNRLIQNHYGYIVQVCKKNYNAFRGDVQFEDLVQTAIVGLIHGINKFDTDSGVRLLTYAHWWMMHELFNTYSLSLPMHIPSNILREMCWRTDQQRAEELNRMYEKIARPLQLQRIHDDTKSEDVYMKRTEFKMACDTTMEHVEKYWLSEDIKKALRSLPEQERKAIWMRAGLDMGGQYTIPEIAKAMKCSQPEVNKHLVRARRTLRKNAAFKRLREVA